MTRIGILISGRGSNMQAIINACASDGFPAEPAIIISNRPGAPGIDFAKDAGHETCVIDHTTYKSRLAFEEDLHAALSDAGCDVICLAGFMRLLSDRFVARWPNRILNVHPSLLPAFKGLQVHERVLEAGVRFSGCTVHIVSPEMDAGPIIAQAVVPVRPGDSPETLAKRVLAQEHRLYPQVVRLMAQGRIKVEGNLALIADCPAADNVLTYPPV